MGPPELGGPALAFVDHPVPGGGGSDVRVGLESLDHGCRGPRQKGVIVVDESEELPLSDGDAGVAGAARSKRYLVTHHADPGVFGQPRGDVGGVVTRRVVDDDQFDLGTLLVEDRTGRPQQLVGAVVGGHHDAQQSGAHRANGSKGGVQPRVQMWCGLRWGMTIIVATHVGVAT